MSLTGCLTGAWTGPCRDDPVLRSRFPPFRKLVKETKFGALTLQACTSMVLSTSGSWIFTGFVFVGEITLNTLGLCTQLRLLTRGELNL